MKRLISFLIRYVPRPLLQRLSVWGPRLIGLFYRGSRVQCPVCGHQFRQFLPYGRVQTRPNALCPHCLSLERHRLIWLYLKEKTNFFKGPHQVLHVAPEACFMPRFQALHGEGYITADIESPLAKVKMDIHQMPFADQQFDFLLCNHVLEHVADDRQALREIYRVLRPGGLAILQVPFFSPVPDSTLEDASVIDPQQREKMFGQRDHVRKYGRDYSERIQGAGLVASTDDFARSVSSRFAVSASELLYIGKRPLDKEARLL